MKTEITTIWMDERRVKDSISKGQGGVAQVLEPNGYEDCKRY